MEINVAQPTLIFVRDNGAFVSTAMTQSVKKPYKRNSSTGKYCGLIEIKRSLSELPVQLYTVNIPISKAKFVDFQVLKNFFLKQLSYFMTALLLRMGRKTKAETKLFGKKLILL